MFSKSIKEMKMEKMNGNRNQRTSHLGTCTVWLAACWLLVVATGCGSKQDPNRLPVFPASGKVNVQGKIPAGAFLVLHPKNPAAGVESVRPRAHVKPDGSFELSSYESNDGAPAGEYTVTVEWRQTIKYPSGDAGPGPNLVPPKYTRPETSPVFIRIAAGTNQLDPIIVK
jgi:hypothetical protein